MKIETRAVVASRGNEYGALVPPAHVSSTFETVPGDNDVPFQYQRVSNPTRTLLEGILAELDGVEHGFAFSTGMAATAAAFSLVSAGDHVLVHASVYGGTFRFAERELQRQGVEVTFVQDPGALTSADLQVNTRLLFVETPTNPTLRVVDLEKLARLAHDHGALFAVDNTFMTPLLQRPFELGADLVVQSATKFLGGHSDLLAGVLTTDRDDIAEQIRSAQKNWGGVPDPQVSQRLVQSIKTLPLRVREQQRNAEKLLGFLEDHPAIERVYFPGWYSEAEKEIHARQAAGIGAVLAVEFAHGIRWDAVGRALRIPAFAVSLGDVSTLLCHPASSTHEDMTDEALALAGITHSLVRISVGIEHIDDLIADFAQAFEAARYSSPESAR